jgi:hypothetical protein
LLQGLEDQLLGDVVRKERPDLEEAKDRLVVSISNDKRLLLVILVSSSSSHTLVDISAVVTHAIAHTKYIILMVCSACESVDPYLSIWSSSQIWDC